ncbi:hypothetical protein SK128_020367, partial [Halocaridina rubra]
ATTGYPTNFTDLLGDVERDESGIKILRAKSSLTSIFMEINRTEVNEGGTISENGGSEEVDIGLFNWEGEFISVLSDTSERPEGLTTYFQSQRSFGEIAGETIVGDVFFLAVGCLILFIYVTVMLGKFNMVETR